MRPRPAGTPPVRLADLLAGLSRLADLGFALPSGTAVRSCVLATRLARSLDLPAADVRASFYTALLHHIGCVGYAHETSDLFGDDLATNAAVGRADVTVKDTVVTFLPALTKGRPVVDRARLAVTALTAGGRWGDAFTQAACEVGRDTARRLQLPDEVQVGLLHVFDLWKDERRPGTLAGEAVPVAARIARLTALAVLFESADGVDDALFAVRRRAGGILDPTLVARFTAYAADWFAELATVDPRAAALELEPVPHLTTTNLADVAAVFGNLADLKNPYLLGHSPEVAALASGAADRLHLSPAATADLEVAGLLHDVGRVAVPNAVWNAPGRLTIDQWEQIRLHPYHTERILAGSDELARLAPLAGRHHERLDGSGYHRGCTGDDLSLPARVLAAADAYRTLTERRPHRAAVQPEPAANMLRDKAGQGVLDSDAVSAVLAAAGRPVARVRRQYPSGLSEREVEVLGLLARGCSNAEIATRLVISRRTAEHHVQHVYTKIGSSSRAAAALFAVEHQLLERNRAQ